MNWQDACGLDELSEAQATLVRVGTAHYIFVRRGQSVHAMEPLCPHKFTSLDESDVQGHLIHCPTHDAAFDLATGIPRPGDEWAGRLATFPCRVEAGRVIVAV